MADPTRTLEYDRPAHGPARRRWPRRLRLLGGGLFCGGFCFLVADLWADLTRQVSYPRHWAEVAAKGGGMILAGAALWGVARLLDK